MNTVRATVWLTYVMIGLVLIAAGMSVWERAHDPMWAQMADSRRNYDIIQGGVAGFALAVAYGLWRQREWGRILAISLAAIILFMFVGTRLLAPFLTSGDVGISFDWGTIVMGVLSSACIVALSRRRFREELTANRAFESGRAEERRAAQRER
jgi:peptidoglycan/LPS O-acetylase OafA/YrhL